MNKLIVDRQLEALKKVQGVRKNGKAYSDHCLAFYKLLNAQQKHVLRNINKQGPIHTGRYAAVPDVVESLENMGLIVRISNRGRFDHLAATEFGFFISQKALDVMREEINEITKG